MLAIYTGMFVITFAPLFITTTFTMACVLTFADLRPTVILMPIGAQVIGVFLILLTFALVCIDPRDVLLVVVVVTLTLLWSPTPLTVIFPPARGTASLHRAEAVSGGAGKELPAAPLAGPPT